MFPVGLKGVATLGGEGDGGLRLFPVVSLDHVHVPCFFELREVRAKVSPGEAGLLKQVGGIGALDDEKIGHDGEASRFMDQTVDGHRRLRARHW